MEPFVYNSPEFQKELANSPHLAGEVNFLTSIAERRMRVIDVGAHRGVTAVALAKKIQSRGRVYAFEPVPEFYNIVKENLSRNGVDNVSVYQKALSNKVNTVRFYKHGGGSGITEADEAEVIEVKATTVDDFVAEQRIDRIDILSLDCEGSELYVFRGARTILGKHGPQIFCEIHHSSLSQLGQSAKQIVVYLQSFGYDVEPLQVESPDKKPGIAECSHIYARKSQKD